LKRRGEKIGWTFGWLGGFLWLALLSMVFLIQGKWAQGLSGMLVFIAAVVTIMAFSLWRHPSTPLWRLMAVPYGVFFISIAWAIWAYGGIEATGLSWWNLLWLFPVLIPFGTLSKRRWSDFDAKPGAPAD